MSKTLTIGEVARRAGLRTSALRYYEGIGLLPEPARVNGQRRYDPSVLQLLALLRFAQQAGFSVAEMQTLLHGFAAEMPPSARWRALAQQKLPEIEALIARAQQMKQLLEIGLNCDCLRLDECVIMERAGCQPEQTANLLP